MSKSGSAQKKEENKKFPIYAFVTFDQGYLQKCRNSVICSKSVMQNYSGKWVGIGETFKVIEGQWGDRPDKKACLVLKFDSMEEAERGFLHNPVWKQNDWMDTSTDVMLARCTQDPVDPAKLPVMALVDVTIHDMPTLMTNYVPGLRDAIKMAGGVPEVTFDTVETYRKVRGGWRPAVFATHQFPSVESYEEFYNSDNYCKLRAIRNECATTNIALIYLTPVAL